MIDHYKIIVNNFLNILTLEKDELEQYKRLQENSIDVLDFSNNLNTKKEDIFLIINYMIEKEIN